jgi:hypothetical protein
VPVKDDRTLVTISQLSNYTLENGVEFDSGGLVATLTAPRQA